MQALTLPKHASTQRIARYVYDKLCLPFVKRLFYLGFWAANVLTNCFRHF